MEDRTYFVIDMKSYFASVECAERGKDPYTTPLVVADLRRGDGALCLAVSAKLKQMGVKNRCRLCEIDKNIDYIIARPRMQKYIDYAAEIYGIYLKYMDKRDIHVYSIDESFIDATDYLKLYNLTAKQFAVKLMDEIYSTLHIPATAGIGTNLYLAKIALDITAKHVKDHIGFLNEEEYKKQLWKHLPLTDFWQIGKGKERRLNNMGLYTMEDVAHADEKKLYKEFGIDAQLLIDHAWGKECCTMEDIKQYKSLKHSISQSQVLLKDYSFSQCKLILNEMCRTLCERLEDSELITNRVSLYISYADSNIPQTGGSLTMVEYTYLPSIIFSYLEKIYNKTTLNNTPIRGIGISYENLAKQDYEFYSIFEDEEKIEKEKRLEKTIANIHKKYNDKNILIKASDVNEYATLKKRNNQIGGHNKIDG